MSVQYGSWTFEHRPGVETDLAPIRAYLTAYGPDGEAAYHGEGTDILFYNLREVQQPASEQQPFVVGKRDILLWDGRLDNRTDLILQLSVDTSRSTSDVAIVAAAYSRWGLACLPKLVGDWALSVWHPDQRQLVLARDFMGARSLFYSVDRTRVQWCTILDPLALFARRLFPLDREYLAGWFGLFPAAHRTPYVGIRSVPPASYVLIRPNSVAVKEFWRFAPGKTVVYRHDAEYEEHFRFLFEQAVRRRLRSEFPVLAELSGGMDSSSIVCMADRIMSSAVPPAPRVDTISYYSSEEPNWNELPYITKVEERRGKAGCHIEVHSNDAFRFDCLPVAFMATPGSLHMAGEAGQNFAEVLHKNGNRVLLSGIGGDEVLGGAPSPAPLLADLFRHGQLQSLAKELLAWSLALRKPVYSLAWETLATFLYGNATRSVHPPGWLCPGFSDGNASAVRGYPRRTRFFGPRPSFQENHGAIEALRRQLSCYPLSAEPSYQKLYPYLDRDLVEFLFSVPQDQILRPHQRRSLMRRALVGIVPDELLNRKRKAFVIRGPLMAMSSHYAELQAIAREMISGSLEIINPGALLATLDEARSGGRVAVTALVRVFAIERWLRNAAHWGVLQDVEPYAKKAAREKNNRRLPVNRELKNSLS
jgi:asparagine synthase (glutamine-hydrolysing)